MNVGTIIAKAVPIAKKAVPVVLAAGFAVFQAISEQNAAGRVANMEQRIKDLEELLKK